MDVALGGFDALVSYEVAEVTAAATYYMAEIYGHFSDALVASERPTGLSEAELSAYELVIEEEAFPFEEQSIAVHQENLELMRVDVFNEWVQRSMGKLAVLMPGRYAKFEISSGFVGSIDHYAYRSPGAPEFTLPITPDTEITHRSEPPEDQLPALSLAGGDDVDTSY